MKESNFIWIQCVFFVFKQRGGGTKRSTWAADWAAPESFPWEASRARGLAREPAGLRASTGRAVTAASPAHSRPADPPALAGEAFLLGTCYSFQKQEGKSILSRKGPRVPEQRLGQLRGCTSALGPTRPGTPPAAARGPHAGASAGSPGHAPSGSPQPGPQLPSVQRRAGAERGWPRPGAPRGAGLGHPHFGVPQSPPRAGRASGARGRTGSPGRAPPPRPAAPPPAERRGGLRPGRQPGPLLHDNWWRQGARRGGGRGVRFLTAVIRHSGRARQPPSRSGVERAGKGAGGRLSEPSQAWPDGSAAIGDRSRPAWPHFSCANISLSQ